MDPIDSRISNINFSLLLFLGIITWSCNDQKSSEIMKSSITKSEFGTLENGETANLFTLVNSSGMEVQITNYGGIIKSIKVADKNGEFGNVVLGFENLEGYTGWHPYFGALVGRYANRIANGQFTLDGETYTLAKNNGENSLHGGMEGFDKKLWRAKEFENDKGVGVELSYTSPDGEEGYPGNMTTKVVYTLTDDNEIIINYEATTDKSTVLNLTNHSYFNLKDAGKSTILGHEVMINSNQITPTDAGSIPLQDFMDVDGTPFDFREAHTIGERIDNEHEQLILGKGYDHNYILEATDDLKLAAKVYEPETEREMEVYTTQPGVQLYTGNFLGTGPEGVTLPPFQYRTGLCLETQHYPDSPNRPDFPSVILNPGEKFESTTIYKFLVRREN